MNIRHATLALAISSAMLVCSQVKADDFDASKYITGDWGGTRADLANKGIEFKLGYFNQTAHNFSGGDSHHTVYADQLFVGSYIDLQKLWGWQGAEFRIEITNRNGKLINDKSNIPYLLESQQINGRGTVTRLTQFSLSQKLFGDHLKIKGGRIYPSADFFSLSCNFQHLQFCSGGSSNYISTNWYGDPLSALGLQATFTPDNTWFFKVGSYDTNPQNLSKNQGLKLGTSGNQSNTLLVGEVEYKPDFGGGIDGDYKIGAIRNSTNRPENVNELGYPTGLPVSDTLNMGPDLAPASHILNTGHGYYFNFEQQVTSDGSGHGLRLFTSLILPEDKVSQLSQVFAIGAFYVGPFASRPDDRIGLAFGRNKVSSQLTDAQRRYYGQFPPAQNKTIGVQRYEYPIELNYNIAVANGIQIMPSLQYIRHPGGLDNADNATILGVQFNLNF